MEDIDGNQDAQDFESGVSQRGTQRPLNVCGACGYQWYPRGADRASACPSCHSDSVTISPHYAETGRAMREQRHNANRHAIGCVTVLIGLVAAGLLQTIFSNPDLAGTGILLLLGILVGYV